MGRDNAGGQAKKKIWLIVILGVVFVALIVELFVYLKVSGFFGEAGNNTNTEASQGTEKWQEGTVTYKGKEYVYNNKIKTYLFLGIDKSGEAIEVEDGIQGGQSDAMYLLVENTKSNTMSIISIHRNAMTMVDVYDKNGEYVGQKRLQICLQHGYGDGMRTSCVRASQTVSRLFYNLPITGYMSLRMEGVQDLTEAIGGVKVKVLEDIDSMGVSLTKGEEKVLSGKEAYAYTRYRDTDSFDSASARIERQQQFLISMMSQAKNVANKGTSAVNKLMDAIDKYMVTNIDFVSLASELKNFSFEDADMYSMPGKTVMGEKFEEFEIDEEAFYQQVIDVFYEPVKN